MRMNVEKVSDRWPDRHTGSSSDSTRAGDRDTPVARRNRRDLLAAPRSGPGMLDPRVRPSPLHREILRCELAGACVLLSRDRPLRGLVLTIPQGA